MISSILGLIMKFFYNIFHNYGISILLFTIVSKILLLPVSILVQKNSVKMVSLMPKLNNIKINYYGDEDKISELESKLYKEEKYNPFISIVPLILQLIILFCFVNVVNHPITYISNLSNIQRDSLVKKIENTNYQELEVVREAKKGNINNTELKNLNFSFFGYDLTLVSIDEHFFLFPFLAALSSLLYCLVDMKYNVLQREQKKSYKITTMLITVLLSLYLGLYVPAGVALYWIFGNLFAILQLNLLNIIINPCKYIDYKELEKSKKEVDGINTENRTPEIIKKEKNDYKRFFKIDNKHLVIYSEDGSYYKYFRGIVDYLLEHSNLPIHYITSDPNDKCLEKNTDQFRTYYIGEKKLISLLMKLDCDIVLMTAPDLDKYHIKRSYVRKDIEYIFITHGIGNYNCFCKKGSLDHFDTIFAYGEYQRKEIITGNKVYNLNRKVIDVGYPLLDEMIKKTNIKNNHTIIIAPSWQKDNIMESCAEDILDTLKDKYKVILRPHPYYVRHHKDRMEELKRKYKDDNSIEIQDDLTTIGNILDSEILITDWSGIAYEFAFITKRPVVFINTPMKIINKDYKELGIELFELESRKILGKAIDYKDIPKIDKIIDKMLKDNNKYSVTIDNYFHDNVYNIGNSSEVAAKYLIKEIKEKIRRKKHD